MNKKQKVVYIVKELESDGVFFSKKFKNNYAIFPTKDAAEKCAIDLYIDDPEHKRSFEVEELPVFKNFKLWKRYDLEQKNKI